MHKETDSSLPILNNRENFHIHEKRLWHFDWILGTAGVEAFLHSWEGENCLEVALVSIITRFLSYINLQNVAITLVVPAWPSASFWPLLWQRYSSLIKEYRYFKGNYACCHG